LAKEYINRITEQKNKEEYENMQKQFQKHIEKGKFFFDNGYEKDAINEWQMALLMVPENMELKENIEKAKYRLNNREYIESGKSYFRKGDIEEAKKCFEQILSVDSENKEVIELLKPIRTYEEAQDLEKNKKYEEAINKYLYIFNSLEKKNPLCAALLYKLGKCSEKNNDANKALYYYRKVLEEYPKSEFADESKAEINKRY